MKNHIRSLEKTVKEYQSLFGNIKFSENFDDPYNWGMIRNKLSTSLDWTEEGAMHIEALSRNYGSFILRNALALSIALNIEDGELGL